MEIHCPICDRLVEEKDIQPDKDIAFCRTCQQDFDLFEAVARWQAEQVDPNNLPRGLSYTTTADGFTIAARTRPIFGLGILFFACVSLAVTIGSAHKTVTSEKGIDAAFWIFLSVGILFDAGLWLLAILCIWGKVRVTARNDNGVIIVGAGPLIWRRNFVWSQVSQVYPQVYRVDNRGNETCRIVMKENDEIAFGSWLPTERLVAFTRLMMKELLKRDSRGGKQT